MSDRFDLIAKPCLWSICKGAMYLSDKDVELWCKRLADAFRWYEDKYLQEALTAAAMMKLHEEKGTCETCRYHEAHDKHMYRSLCGRLTWNTKDDFGCIEYSRRIEEVK
jgi:hypothetical protein